MYEYIVDKMSSNNGNNPVKNKGISINISESETRQFVSFFNTKDFPDISDWWKSIPIKVQIGRGTFSAAYLVTDLSDKNYIVRITPVIGKKERQVLQREIQMYQRLQSDPKHLQYISGLLYADYPSIYHNKPEYDQAYFVFRYVQGLPLDTFIHSFENRKYLTLDKLQDWANQLVNIVQFLQTHTIVHRDIKPANLFVDTTNDRLVVFDFGSACFHGEDCNTTDFHGTREYASPNSLYLLSESPLHVPYQYSSKNDTYAIGVILKSNLVSLVDPKDHEAYTTFLKNLGF